MTMPRLGWFLAVAALMGCADPHDANSPASTATGSASAASSEGEVRGASGPSSSASTPEEAWQRLLAAMRNGEALEPYATESGIRSLDAGVHDEPRATAFARWGKGWQAWEVRWIERSEAHARANLGPEAKEHGLEFVRTPAGWKLERWQPGE